MPREVTDSISFIVQAEFNGKNAANDDDGFRYSSTNLIESSNLYGFLFLCQGNFLHISSVVKAEEQFDGGDNSLLSDISFKINFPSEIISLCLSSSESYLAVTSGDKLFIISVPNLLTAVCCSSYQKVDDMLSELISL